jgi:glutathione S-transferase
VRIYALAEGDVLPNSVIVGLENLPNFSKWAAAIRKEPSVLSIWDAERFVGRTKARLDKMQVVAPNRIS